MIWAIYFWYMRGMNDILHTMTFYPEPTVLGYVTQQLSAGAQIVKVHVQVGAFDPREPVLDEVWGVLADAGTPIVVHAGSGPVGNEYTGPGGLAKVLRQHPSLAVIVAHMGAPEYAEFLVLAEQYDAVRLDTTMVFTEFFDDASARFPTELLPRLVDLQPKVLFGSDFPTIPYPYGEALAGLARLGLGEEWLRDVCWRNGVRLFGEPAVRK